jgi:hypothetical protein
MVTDRTRGRAQLILLGAVTLAVLIVGVTVVVNSLTVTRTAGPSQASPQIDEAREFSFESRKGVRSLVVRLNHRHRNQTAPELATLVADNVSAYGRLLAESYASSHAEYVSLTYDNDSSAFGRRVVQVADDNVTDASGARDWQVGDPGEYRQIGRFTLNLNVDNTSTTAGRIVVSNGSERVTYHVSRTTNGSLNVTSDLSYAGNVTGVCDPSRQRVLVDLREGSSFSGDCSFNGTTVFDGPYTVRVENGANLVGKYELVYNESMGVPPGTYDRCENAASVPGTDPCTAPAVWVASVSVSFDSSETRFTNGYNVSIYGDRT